MMHLFSMLYLMDYERIYKTQDPGFSNHHPGKKMMEKKMLAETLSAAAYSVYPIVYSGSFQNLSGPYSRWRHAWFSSQRGRR